MNGLGNLCLSGMSVLYAYLGRRGRFRVIFFFICEEGLAVKAFRRAFGRFCTFEGTELLYEFHATVHCGSQQIRLRGDLFDATCLAVCVSHYFFQKQTRVVATLREVWRAHCCRRRDLAMSSKSKQQQQLRASRWVFKADDNL